MKRTLDAQALEWSIGRGGRYVLRASPEADPLATIERDGLAATATAGDRSWRFEPRQYFLFWRLDIRTGSPPVRCGRFKPGLTGGAKGALALASGPAFRFTSTDAALKDWKWTAEDGWDVMTFERCVPLVGAPTGNVRFDEGQERHREHLGLLMTLGWYLADQMWAPEVDD